MGQYIEKSNIILRWLLIAANFITLVLILIVLFYGIVPKLTSNLFQVLCLSVVSVGVWTIGFKSFISGLLTDRLFLSCAYLQVTLHYCLTTAGIERLYGWSYGLACDPNLTLPVNKTIRKRKQTVTIHYL